MSGVGGANSFHKFDSRAAAQGHSNRYSQPGNMFGGKSRNIYGHTGATQRDKWDNFNPGASGGWKASFAN